MTSRVAIALGMTALAAVGLSACAAKTTDPAAAPNGCTKESLATPAADAARAMGADNVYAIDHLECADGWAVTGGLLADKSNPAMGAPRSFVFQQQGQAWMVQDKAAVCGTNPITTTPPADATIPAALFLPGCAAG